MYKLDAAHNIVEETNSMTWAQWFEKADRHVDKTVIDKITVSTVFLGIDHNFGEGQPILFETMIFGGPRDQYTDRYCTWDEAKVGHAIAVKLAKAHE